MQLRESVTIKVLAPTTRKRKALESLRRDFAAAVALGLDLAEPDKTSSRKKLHDRLYHRSREEFDLASYYAKQAVNAVMAKVRAFWGSANSKHSGYASWPKANSNEPVLLDINAYRLFRDGDRWTLRISIGNRQFLWLPLCMPKKFHDRLSLCYGDAKLYERNGKWYVNLPLRITTDTPAVSDGPCFGVDLGVAKLATLVGPDTVRFWSGGRLQHVRRRNQHYRRACGRSKNVRKLRQNRHRESRWAKDINHKVSREIVELVAGVPGAFIALENLSGIRDRSKYSKRFNRMVSSWSFRQLIQFIEYKAARAGVPVVFVDPRGTSSTCPECGEKGNRPDQAHFRCTSCGYRANADYVGGLNISRRGLYAHADAPSASGRPERAQDEALASSQSVASCATG